ncbi:MAG: lysophospholipid acyltransferase family protein [Candidatus Promineifilaceae bacterium]
MGIDLGEVAARACRIRHWCYLLAGCDQSHLASGGPEVNIVLKTMIIIHFLRALAHFLRIFVGSFEVYGRENIPESGPYIVVINHMSKVDPPLVLITLPPLRLRFFAGESWRKHLIFGTLMRGGGAVYIRRGEADRKALREAFHALEDGSVFALAPEGTRSKVGALIKARDGAAYLASRSNVTLVPLGIVNTDQVGKNLLSLRRTRMIVNVGPTFSLPDIGRRPKGTDLSAYTHLIMVHIAAQLPERHWGYYADSPALKALFAGEDPWPHCLAAEKSPI